MEYDKTRLGTMDDIRAIYHARPVVDIAKAQCILDKHDLGRATGLQPLGPYVTNFIYRIDREELPPLVLKGQYRPTKTWDVRIEAEAIPLLRDGSDLPVPAAVIYDGDTDVLDHSYCLIDWLDGRSTLEAAKESPLDDRLTIAEQMGAVHRAIHDCPVPSGADLPLADLRDWRRLTQGQLLAGDALHRELQQLCPAFEDILNRGLEMARDTPSLRPPVLVWRDGSPGNTVCRVDNGSLRICGVFDFQSAIIMQPTWDLIKAFNHYVPGSEPDRPPTPEWCAFCSGYGAEQPLDPAERCPFSVVGNAMHTRHWYESMGFLHPQTPAWLDGLLSSLGQLRLDTSG